MSKVKERKPFILGGETFSRYAVLVPLIEIQGEIHVLFEVRSLLLRRQPGEVCFPGGRMDPEDKDPMATALRETHEELGFNKQTISQIAPLDFLVSPFGMIVYPFVGKIGTLDELKINKNEVDHVFTVPLSFFQNKKPHIHYIHVKLEPEPEFPYESIVGGKEYKWQLRKMEECFYYYKDWVIWGLTARVMRHFVNVIK